ncbi:MAG: hypothetical protein EA427_04045 [Spirochaetaceae bacterium]|nr:MAG: hypothetical protein EA427_04045 [Spirochaetaceae bacterium]
MRAYAGRIAGAALGSMAGVPGAVFGLLAGCLVDQYRLDGAAGYRLERFIRRPDLERKRPVAQLLTVVTLAAFLSTEGSSPFPHVPWEKLPKIPGDRRHREAALKRALEYRERIDPARIAGEAQRNFPDSEGGVDRLLDVLVEAVAGDMMAGSTMAGDTMAGARVDAETAARLRLIGMLLPASPSARSRLERSLGGLDPLSCRVLDVAGSAGREEVRRAYRRLAASLHPDTAGDLDPTQQQELREAFVRVRAAHDTLLVQLDCREAIPQR